MRGWSSRGKQVAGDIGGVFPLAPQRAAVEAAGGDLRLADGPVGQDFDRFGAALPAEMGAVGLPVVEDIPLPRNLHDTAVVVAAIRRRLIRRFVGIDMGVVV